MHRNFYRLQESTRELSKISKLLIATNEGSVGALAGKTLKDPVVEEAVSEAINNHKDARTSEISQESDINAMEKELSTSEE